MSDEDWTCCGRTQGAGQPCDRCGAREGTEGADGAMVIARVTVTRVLYADDITDYVSAETGDGSELGLAEALGMMRLGEDTLIRSRLDGDDD